MKTKIHIDDYNLKIETETMDVNIVLRRPEQVRDILQLTKDTTEMAIDQSKKIIKPPIPKASPGRTINPKKKPKLKKKICKGCGIEYTPTSNVQVFHNIVCKTPSTKQRKAEIIL